MSDKHLALQQLFRRSNAVLQKEAKPQPIDRNVFLELNGLSPQQLKNPVRRMFKKVAYQTQKNPYVNWTLFFTSAVILYKVLPYEAFNDEL